MTGLQRGNAVAAPLPDSVSHMQTRIEALYLSRLALEREVQALQATQPVLMGRSLRPSLVMRVLMRFNGRLRRRHDLKLIRQCGLFDADWYLETYGDVAESGAEPALHFLMHGAADRRNPGPHFDTEHYLHLYPDIAQNGMNPLLHYLVSGHAELRSIRPGMPHGGVQ